MNNIKKIALGLLVGALAIGFSAFTNGPVTKHNGVATARYYNKTGIVNDMIPGDFIYRDGLEDDCNSSTTKECTAEWTTTNAPVANQSPTDAGSPSYSGNTSLGVYNGH